jgi:hypothetical protein
VHQFRSFISRTIQLALASAIAILVAACGSHLLATWLKIKTTAAQAYTIGQPNGRPPAFLAGSSLANYGISWQQIAGKVDMEIRAWGIAGGSPFEWEQFQKKVPDAGTTFIVVSAYDLDESMICDFRADLVPMSDTIKTLLTIHADWDYSERALSQYPMTWLRTLFPTLGRSRGIMGDLRIKIKNAIWPSAGTSETAAGPTLKFGQTDPDDEYKKQRISDWSKSKMAGKIIAMRAFFHGSQSFCGPKKLAFERMLQYADQRGRTVVVLLPVSASYSKEFMLPEAVHKFEDALAEAQSSAPRAQWFRVDQVPAFSSDENFCDLVHMNIFGQKTITEAFLAWLKPPARQQ